MLRILVESVPGMMFEAHPPLLSDSMSQNQVIFLSPEPGKPLRPDGMSPFFQGHDSQWLC